jgi:hypothetical protein
MIGGRRTTVSGRHVVIATGQKSDLRVNSRAETMTKVVRLIDSYSSCESAGEGHWGYRQLAPSGNLADGRPLPDSW